MSSLNSTVTVGHLANSSARCGWYPDRVLRVYRPEYTGYNHALVHESVVKPQDAKIVNLHGDLLHYTFDSLPHYMAKQTQYAKRLGRTKTATR